MNTRSVMMRFVFFKVNDDGNVKDRLNEKNKWQGGRSEAPAVIKGRNEHVLSQVSEKRKEKASRF